MSEQERIELEAEQAGRDDYRHERMKEVDVMNAADEDYLREVWLASRTPEERTALWKARLAEDEALATWRRNVAAESEHPF
jgi:hypothetical protein